MAKLALVKGTTSQTALIFIQDSSSTTGAGLAALAWDTASLSAYYYREGAGTGATAWTLATMTIGTWATGGFVEVDATNMPGWYEIGIPNACLAAGVDFVGIQFKGAANMAQTNLEIQLTDFNLNDASPLVTLAAETHTGAIIPTVTTCTTTTTNTDMRGTDSAALASVCTEGRLSELDAANLPTDVAAIPTTAMRGTDSAALASVCTEVRLAELDAANLPTDIAAIPTTAMRGTDSAALATSLATAQLDLDIITGADGVNLLSGTQASIDAIEVDTSTTLQAELDAIQSAVVIQSGTADSGSTTTLVDAALTQTDNDYWRGCFIRFTSGTISGQTRRIVSFIESTDTLTFEPPATQAVSTNTYDILPGTSDWDATTSNHAVAFTNGIEMSYISGILTDTDTTIPGLIATAQTDLDTITGATGVNLLAATQASIDAIEADTNELQTDWVDGGRLDNLLDGAASAGDPWTAALPGAYGAGTAGKIVGDNINAPVGSIPTTAMRGTDSAALASVCTEGRLAELDAANLPTDIAAIPTTAMRGTDSAALASVCTEGRLAELDAANLPTDIAAIPTTAMRGTDSAATAANLATAQADLDIITGATGVNLLVATQQSIDDIETDTSSTLDGKIDSILSDTGTDGVVISAATANAIADALLDRADGIEPASAGTERTVREALRIILAASAGKLAGAATTTVTIQDTNDTKARITATVDADGNRSAVTLIDT